MYPAADYPFTLYFNGRAMARWANCWPLSDVASAAAALMDNWGEAVGSYDLWDLHNRIDHVGTIESADPETFCVCCLTVAFLMIRDEAAIRSSVSPECIKLGSTPNEIYDSVLAGLFTMQKLTVQDGFAIWTSGYEPDQNSLLEYLRRHGLPRSDPEWLDAPHRKARLAEATHRVDVMRRKMITMLGTHALPKEIRGLIHEIPMP